MGLFKRRVLTGKGSYLALETTKWDAEWRSYSVTGESREALDVTHTRSPGGVMEFEPGGFVNPGTIEVALNWNIETPPPIRGPKEPMRLVLMAVDSTERVIFGGMGFLLAKSFEVPEGGANMTGTVTIQRTSEWTILPAEPVEAL